MSDKNDIRRRVRRQRRALSSEDRARAAVRVAAFLGAMNSFRGARRVAIFAANDGEIDLRETVKRYARKDYFLPLVPGPGRLRMKFGAIGPGVPFARNRFGILEPDVPPASMYSARELDLVLTPLVAFDRSGGRLGMGGGFYDATFEFLSSRSCWQHPKMIGVAFSFQEVPQIERNPWDIPLSAVVTEHGPIFVS